MDNSERVNIKSLRNQINEVLNNWWDERVAADAERRFLGERVAGLEEEVAKLEAELAESRGDIEVANRRAEDALARAIGLELKLNSASKEIESQWENICNLNERLSAAHINLGRQREQIAKEQDTAQKILNMNSLADLEKAAKLHATPKPLAELVCHQEQYQIYRVTEALTLMFFQSFVGDRAEEKAIAATRKLNRAANGFYMLLKATTSRSTVCTNQEPVASEEEEN